MCLWFCVAFGTVTVTLYIASLHMTWAEIWKSVPSWIEKSAINSYRNSRKEVQQHLSKIKAKSSVMLLLLLPILKFSWAAWISNTETCMYSFDIIHTLASWVLHHSYKSTILSIFKDITMYVIWLFEEAYWYESSPTFFLTKIQFLLKMFT